MKENCDYYDEDKYTIKMMFKHGIDNVRGGSFCSIILQTEEIKVITKMINNANDKCFKCYSESHFCTKCPYEKISHDMLILKHTIINKCRDSDKRCQNEIEIDELRIILNDCSSIYF